MKKFLLSIILCVVSITAFGQVRTPNDAEYILKDGYSILYHPTDRKWLAYRAPNGKIGFVRNNSSPSVVISPVFDDAIDVTKGGAQTTLIAVKWNGKWGAIDTSHESVRSNQPIIECKYDMVRPLDNYRVEAVDHGHRWILDIRDLSVRTYYGE